jgi:uncharacterized membrane protein YfcA
MPAYLSLTEGQWTLALLGAFIIGMGKAGLKGLDMLSVTLMAMVFGGKGSTGVVLPLLCVADIAAVIYYKRHVKWQYFFRLIPWMVVGILVGVWVGNRLDEVLFRKIMAVIILVTVLMVLLIEFRLKQAIPDNRLLAASTGLLAGFTSMIGNLAGAFANVYFLAMRAPKNDFIGTTAWIFLCINLFKFPFQVWVWKNIHLNTLSTDLLLLPLLAAGFAVGIKLIGMLDERLFRKVVIVLTVMGGLVMLARN